MEEITFSDEIVVLFANQFRKIIKDEIETYVKDLNVERFIDLSVISVSDDYSTANLKDLTTKEVYENIPNHTGVKLASGNTVRMYYGGGQEYIGRTWGDRTKYLCQEEG